MPAFRFRRGGLWRPLLMLALFAAVAASAWSGWPWPWAAWLWDWATMPQRAPGTWFLLGGLANLLAVAVVLGLRARWQGQGMLRDLLMRDLRYHREADTPDQLARKAGLLRDLAQYGPLPRDLERLVAPGADLRGLDFSGCSLRAAQLAGADCSGASFRGADLWGADLEGAVLERADLRQADLRGATLTGATLNKARLEGANLRRTSLVNANLTGAALQGARLHLARFADPEQDGLEPITHPSLEDWLRAKLNSKGEFEEG